MLTLILQTQEGHQIELNVQPDDTFADLKSQYADHEVVGLSHSLEQLITNGANVAENMKIFDYVTASAQEWYSTDTVNQPATDQPVETEKKIKECCARDCTNNVATTPGKSFFPLPTDHVRLSVCLIEIGRPDLYNRIFRPDTEECQKYFLCNSHFNQESSLTLQGADEQLPVLKPKNDRPKLNVIDETILTKEKKVNDKHQELECDGKDSELGLFGTDENIEHPGILCRLCGKIAENPIHLYAKETVNIEDEFNLADKINLCLPVTITVMDPLPKQICQDCRVKLDICHDLALSSLQTEDKLKALLRENRLCVNVNAKQQCPLCIEGDMGIVKKSGIYRREELKDDLYKKKTDNEDTKDLSLSVKLHLPILDNSVSAPMTIENDLEAQSSTNDISLSLPNGEFSCSICSSKIVDFTAIKSHECHHEDQISFRSCVICKNTNFTDNNELEAHYRRHGLVDDKLNDVLERYTSLQFDKTTDNPKMHNTKNCQIRCENCDKILPNEEKLTIHDCSQIAHDLEIFEEHFLVKTDHDDQTIERTGKESKVPYNCHFCEKQFTRKGSLEKHITTMHNGPLNNFIAPRCYKCKNCCEAFAREIDAETHTSLAHFVSFASTNTIFEHSDEFNTEELIATCLYVCEYCERCFTIPSSLHEHRESEHINNLKYSCLMCNQTFDSRRQLANHKSLRSHRKPLDGLSIRQYYVCKYCDKTFLHHSRYTAHALQHRKITVPYLCRICNLNFLTYREIALHRKISHPYQSALHERTSFTYNCQYCRKEFAQEVALIKHIRVHTGERPYKCTICDKGFSQSSGLYTHLTIHSDLRPYTCTKCPRAFKMKRDRDRHIKRHAGNRPYKCEFCKKAFMTQHVYSQHRKIHTDERPYKCDICGQAFRRSHVLTVHMRRHTGEKPHVCEICLKSYRQRGDYLKHQKIQHGICNNVNSNLSFNDVAADADSYDNFTKTREKNGHL